MNADRWWRETWMAPMAALLLITLSATGCQDKTTARKQSQMAFLAGRAAAVAEAKPMAITITGAVAQPTIEWRADLTLAQALIEAGWQGSRDPRTIILRRGGFAHPFNTEKFLRGQTVNPVLEPGDAIELKP